MIWRHLANDITITSDEWQKFVLFTALQTEQNTYNYKTATRCQHFNTFHVNWTCVHVSAVLSHYELHSTSKFINDCWWIQLLQIASNISEVLKKLTFERKSLVKQQILMYKTAVYRLVSGEITHQKQQVSEKGDIARQYIDT